MLFWLSLPLFVTILYWLILSWNNIILCPFSFGEARKYRWIALVEHLIGLDLHIFAFVHSKSILSLFICQFSQKCNQQWCFLLAEKLLDKRIAKWGEKLSNHLRVIINCHTKIDQTFRKLCPILIIAWLLFNNNNISSLFALLLFYLKIILLGKSIGCLRWDLTFLIKLIHFQCFLASELLLHLDHYILVIMIWKLVCLCKRAIFEYS